MAAWSVRLVIVLGLGLVVLGRAPGAWACECVYSDTTPRGDSSVADLIFTGTTTSVNDPNGGASIKTIGDPIEWRFSVEAVQKGRGRRTQVVTTARSETACGFGFALDRRYQVFASLQDGGYTTGLCSATQVLAAGTTAPRPLSRNGPPATAPLVALGLATTVGGAVLKARSSSPQP